MPSKIPNVPGKHMSYIKLVIFCIAKSKQSNSKRFSLHSKLLVFRNIKNLMIPVSKQFQRTKQYEPCSANTVGSAKIAAVGTSGRCRYFELSSVGTHCSQPPDNCSTQSMLIFYPNISSIVIVLNENTE